MNSSQIKLIIAGFILVIFIATNPSIEDHRMAVMDKLRAKIAEHQDSKSDNRWAELGEAIGLGIVEKVVGRDNYFLFSMTKVEIANQLSVVKPM